MRATVPKIGVISLGCPKNRVDTEVMIGLLQKEGYQFVQDMSQADAIVINTCAFIDAAAEEGFGTILEAGEQKRYGSVKGIVVAGCLPERYKDKLRKLAPEADVLIGVAGYKEIVPAVEAALKNQRIERFPDLTLDEPFSERVVTTIAPTAYLKIAEGCDNGCTYCIIPSIRGKFQSRPMEDIKNEAADLVSRGYSEIILVAQDTSKYGIDLYGKGSLPELLESLADIEGLKWLRVLYTYPEGVTDELLDVMMRHDNIVKYLDIPMQHMSDGILRRMNRHTTGAKNIELITKIRERDPGFVTRSTFIVGFPGETSEDFDVLMKAVNEAQIDRLGVFCYSREEGTPAARMDDQIDEETKGLRQRTLMNQQSRISFARNMQRVDREYDVLIEGYDPRTRLYYGRSYAEIPEVDGLVYVRGDNLELQQFYRARVTRALNHDCLAQVLPDSNESAENTAQ